MNTIDSPSLNFVNQDAASTSQERVTLIEKLLAIGTALSSQKDLRELLSLILSKMREITWSDGGSVYLVDRSDEISKLLFKVSQNDSLTRASFNEFAVPLTRKSLAGYVALTGESLNIPDAHNLPADVPYQLDGSFDRDFSYRTRSVLVLPMQDQQKEVIGVVQLLNRKVKQDAIVTPENALEVTRPYDQWEERILRCLASQAAISIERNSLQNSIENLFEGFARASVQVIEARDPNTSGHSERVAELTVRLSEEINTTNFGPLGSLKFDERQLQEIRYAALLHDFGKVGVPEAILNKSKKLYPEQLEIIRQRFAVARRTLELECAQFKYQYLLRNPENITPQVNSHSCHSCYQLDVWDEELAKALGELENYWRLINQINEPDTLDSRKFRDLSEEAYEKLMFIGQYTYKDVDGQEKPLLTPLEVEQLMIPRGNLTKKERLAIEAHVTHSYEFLKRIPWTKHLKNIPLIAYRHHERSDGTGYPLGVTQDKIPVQTQMLIIADIYDALTGERPYKTSLSVDVVLKMMREEADKNHINGDLVDIFIQRRVYKVLGH